MTHIYVAGNSRWQTRASLMAMVFLLAACTGSGIRPGVDDQRHWQISGKLGLRGPQLAESAYLNWRQCGESYDMRISGPLGQTVARIDGTGARLTVRLEGQEPVTTDNPELLLQEQLGWSVPLRALRYWVRAEQAPGPSAEVTGPAGQPSELRQLGWQVRYLAWHQAGALALPAKLTLRNDSGLQATLIISDWLLSDAVQGCPR